MLHSDLKQETLASPYTSSALTSRMPYTSRTLPTVLVSIALSYFVRSVLQEPLTPSSTDDFLSHKVRTLISVKKPANELVTMHKPTSPDFSEQYWIIHCT